LILGRSDATVLHRNSRSGLFNRVGADKPRTFQSLLREE
jgi:hypothetical protein